MLITRCPNCATTFRVRMEQLNLRGGRVRCGHCHIPFSALASLEELPEETATTQRVLPTLPVPPAQSAPLEVAPSAALAAPDMPAAPEALVIELPFTEPPAVAPQPTEAARDELVALIDLPAMPSGLHGAGSVSGQGPQHDSDDTDQAHAAGAKAMLLDEGGALHFDIEGLAGAADRPDTQTDQATGATGSEAPQLAADEEIIQLGTTDDDDAEAFDREFEKNLGIDDDDDTLIGDGEVDEDRDEDGEHIPQLHTVFLDEDIPPGAGVDPALIAARAKARRTLILGNLLLLVTGVLLSAYVLRVELTRYYPGLRGPLEQACQAFSCDVPYPRDADEVLLVGSDLTQAGTVQGGYHLAVTVRNHARYPVAWPQLEITLTDRYERALTRRVLEPKEWLPANLADRPAFEAQGELTSQIALSSDSQVAGYRLGVFYR